MKPDAQSKKIRSGSKPRQRAAMNKLPAEKGVRAAIEAARKILPYVTKVPEQPANNNEGHHRSITSTVLAQFGKFV